MISTCTYELISDCPTYSSMRLQMTPRSICGLHVLVDLAAVSHCWVFSPLTSWKRLAIILATPSQLPSLLGVWRNCGPLQMGGLCLRLSIHIEVGAFSLRSIILASQVLLSRRIFLLGVLSPLSLLGCQVREHVLSPFGQALKQVLVEEAAK